MTRVVIAPAYRGGKTEAMLRELMACGLDTVAFWGDNGPYFRYCRRRLKAMGWGGTLVRVDPNQELDGAMRWR